MDKLFALHILGIIQAGMIVFLYLASIITVQIYYVLVIPSALIILITGFRNGKERGI
jgi:hypothetical protein